MQREEHLAEETRPSAGTLALLYDEVGKSLDDEHAYVEALNARAQQLFSFATVILAILAGVIPTHPHTGTKVAYAISLPIFALAAYYSGRAWEFRKWRSDPDVKQLWEHYRGRSEEHVRHQVIQNRLACLSDNEPGLTAKLGWIKRARVWLYLGFVYVAALLLYQILTG
jgi:hypothetical protein